MRKKEKRSKLDRVRKALDLYIEDLLILSGLFFIVYATFMLNKTAGIYSLGICLLALGVWTCLHPKNRGGD